MKIKYAPLLHARTKNVDFHSGFLVLPAGFSEADARYAHSLVLDSTRFLELAGPDGRRVVFGNGNFVVTGITIIIEDLFKKCGLEPEYHKVDHKDGRLAYGFIGIAMPVSKEMPPFDVPYETFLNIYRKHIKARWEETLDSEGVHDPLKIQFEEAEVPAAVSIPNYDAQFAYRSGKLLLEDTIETRDGIAAYVLSKALRKEQIALCTDITLPKAIAENGFDIITCKNASAILPPEIRNEPLPKQPTSSVPAKEPLSRRMMPRVQKAAPAPQQPVRNKVQSLDAILSEHGAPSSIEDSLLPENTQGTQNPISPRPPAKAEKKTGSDTVSPYEETIRKAAAPDPSPNIAAEAATILGIVAGVTFVAIAIASQAAPVVLATVGSVTVVLVGVEAKRIIDRFQKK